MSVLQSCCSYEALSCSLVCVGGVEPCLLGQEGANLRPQFLVLPKETQELSSQLAPGQRGGLRKFLLDILELHKRFLLLCGRTWARLRVGRGYAVLEVGVGSQVALLFESLWVSVEGLAL